MCHLNASVVIKSIPGTELEFIILRKDTAEEDIAVKAVTNFPAVFDQFDQLHSVYKNVRIVTIQKVQFLDMNCLLSNPIHLFSIINFVWRLDQVLEL